METYGPTKSVIRKMVPLMDRDFVSTLLTQKRSASKCLTTLVTSSSGIGSANENRSVLFPAKWTSAFPRTV